jgi:hypothetical protein
MFNSQILDVAIGVIFVFLMVSVICSAIREGIEAWLKTRASYLEYGIRTLFQDIDAKGITKSFFNHPSINGLFSGTYSPGGTSKPSFWTSGSNLPSYIPAGSFATALMDIAARGPSTIAVSGAQGSQSLSLDSIRTNISNIENPAIQRVLLTAVDSAQGDITKAQTFVENWYNSSMDRVSGWYKRSTQWVIFVVGLVLAIVLNINTLTIANYLYGNGVARAAVVQQAQQTTSSVLKEKPEEAKAALEALPIGWPQGLSRPTTDWKGSWYDWVSLVVGWLITAFAASMGAPFWFDILNKFMVIRSTVKPHEKSPEEASDDRQPSGGPPPPPPGGPTVAPVVLSAPGPDAPADTVVSDPALTDPEYSVDGCEVAVGEPTQDDDLPASEGGVEP